MARLKVEFPKGSSSNNLKGVKNRYLRDVFKALPAVKQSSIRQISDNYFRACKSHGSPTDEDFFKEIILDARNDRFAED